MSINVNQEYSQFYVGTASSCNFRRWLCGGREDYFKEAAQRKASIERSQEAAEERKQQMEIAYRKQAMAEFFASHTVDMSRAAYTGTPGGFCDCGL